MSDPAWPKIWCNSIGDALKVSRWNGVPEVGLVDKFNAADKAKIIDVDGGALYSII